MKKWKYFRWHCRSTNIYDCSAIGPALVYINANTKEEAKFKLKKILGYKHDPHFISGDVVEVHDFVQPQPIKII